MVLEIMTLLGANEETGDLLAAVEPDYLSSIEPAYTQTDLVAISVANSRGWNQVLVDSTIYFPNGDTVNNSVTAEHANTANTDSMNEITNIEPAKNKN